MGIFSAISKGFKAVIDDINTPESFKAGQAFEDYVRDKLFTKNYYEMLERTHNYQTNKDYVKSSLKPDFKFEDKFTKRQFYVEAKFRTKLYQNKVVWCDDFQLARYARFDKESPVFVVLGLGGEPNNPEFLSLLPIFQARYTGLFDSHIEKFEIKASRPVQSTTLWQRQLSNSFRSY